MRAEPAAAQVGGDTGGRQPTLDPRREVLGDLGLGESVAALTRVGSAVTWVDDDDLASQRRPQPADALLLAHDRRFATDDGPHEPVDGLERRRPAGAVGEHADVALEVLERSLGVQPEDAVVATRVEAELEQAPLEGEDVVAGQEVARRVPEDAVTEAPPGVVEQAPGLRADDAVDGRSALLLEPAYGGIDRVVELSVVVVTSQLADTRAGAAGSPEESEHREPGADLGHRRTDVTETVESRCHRYLRPHVPPAARCSTNQHGIRAEVPNPTFP